MEIKEILARCDHTLLSRTATLEDIRQAVADAKAFGAASVCIPPSFVSAVRTADVPICTVVGFPNGYNETEVKLFEAARALSDGADEIDAVINVNALKDRRYDDILFEISRLKRVVGDRVLKIIIETCLLSDEEKIKMCALVYEGGADFIKTSTGFDKGGAKREDIVLMRKNLHPSVKIKAAGGIRTISDAEEFIRLGADRIGASAIIQAVKAGGNNGQK